MPLYGQSTVRAEDHNIVVEIRVYVKRVYIFVIGFLIRINS